MIEHWMNGLRVLTSRDGVVLWMADWSQAEELVELGYLRRRLYVGGYCTVEYVLDRAA